MGHLAVVVGFGVVGATAARQLLESGMAPGDIAVVDNRPAALEAAVELRLRECLGDGTERELLQAMTSERTTCLIVTPGPDETAVMATLLARDLCPHAMILTAVRDGENVDHARRVGADVVIATSQWTGRALAFALARTGLG
jgi:voltage-gated potassium channel